jgi:TRAP-type transport system periplasmic protein
LARCQDGVRVRASHRPAGAGACPRASGPRRILAGLLALFWVFAFSAARAAEPFVMKLSAPTANDMNHEWMRQMKAGVEARSAGRIRVEIYPANQLGQIPRTVEGVALGTIESTMPATGFLIGLDPRFAVFDAVGLFDDMVQANRVFQDPQIRQRLAGFGASKGVEPLLVYATNPNVVVSHKPIRSLPDFAGQRLRVPGGAPLYIEPYRKLGASPISMPLGEALPAMQNHTIDGSIAGLTVFTTFKYYDITHHLTYLPSSLLVVAAVVNRNFLKSLGPELEAVVRDESRRIEQECYTWLMDDIERARQQWRAHGGELINLPAPDAKRFVDQMGGETRAILAANTAIREDFEALSAAALRYRTAAGR